MGQNYGVAIKILDPKYSSKIDEILVSNPYFTDGSGKFNSSLLSTTSLEFIGEVVLLSTSNREMAESVRRALDGIEGLIVMQIKLSSSDEEVDRIDELLKKR